MRSYELTCQPPAPLPPDDNDCFDTVETLLSLQHGAGWLHESQLIHLADDGGQRYLLMAWEGYDWDAACAETYASFQYKRLLEMGVDLQLREVGRIAGWEKENGTPKALVLQSNPYGGHALVDMETFEDVSLRCIPRDPDRSFDAYRFWKGDYDAVYRLWQGGVKGQRALRHELFDLRSYLNQAGRKVCADFEARSGIPTYYYLWRDSARISRQHELHFKLGVDHPEESELVLDNRHYAFINHKERLIANVVSNHQWGFSDWVRKQSGI